MNLRRVLMPQLPAMTQGQRLQRIFLPGVVGSAVLFTVLAQTDFDPGAVALLALAPFGYAWFLLELHEQQHTPASEGTRRDQEPGRLRRTQFVAVALVVVGQVSYTAFGGGSHAWYWTIFTVYALVVVATYVGLGLRAWWRKRHERFAARPPADETP